MHFQKRKAHYSSSSSRVLAEALCAEDALRADLEQAIDDKREARNKMLAALPTVE